MQSFKSLIDKDPYFSSLQSSVNKRLAEIAKQFEPVDQINNTNQIRDVSFEEALKELAQLNTYSTNI